MKKKRRISLLLAVVMTAAMLTGCGGKQSAGSKKPDDKISMCQLAVSKTVEQDEAKRAAVMEVLSALFSEEGQKHVAAGTSVLSYNKEVNITSSPALRYVQDCIASNHLYMRLASTEVFAISRDVGHRMMTGEYDAKAAYDAFDAQITDYKNPDAAQVMFTQESAYSNEFTDHGSAAASSLMNTIRSSMGADIAIGYSPTASTSIYAGDYTLQQAKWVLTARNSVYLGEYTGEEVWRFMDWLVNVKEDGSNPIRHRNLMPVTSGLEYTVTEYERGKFRLEKVTVNGEPLDENATYNLMLVGADNFLEHENFCNCPMPADLKEKRQAYLVDDYSSQEVYAGGTGENETVPGAYRVCDHTSGVMTGRKKAERRVMP